jgi:hypothetical protein
MRWWLYGVSARDRLVLLAGLTVRLAGVALLGYVVPLIWLHVPRPGASALLAALLAIESLAVCGWWFRSRRLDPRVLWLDLPVGVLALFAGAALTDPYGMLGWTLFTYPYLILVSFGLGLACRRLIVALAVGAAWAAANVAALAVFHPAPLPGLLLVAPAYLINPAIGWGLARLLYRGADEVAAARVAAVRETADLVATAQRARMTAALHDRILQTLETLSRGGAIADPDLRERVGSRAAWLRRYLETGQVDQSDDLTTALEAAVRAARQSGINVEVNDALLRTLESGTDLPAEQRDALVEAVFQTISAFRRGREVVVRATPEDGGILITVLSAGPDLPDADDIGDAGSRLASAGGRLSIEAAPYAELWVPRTGTAAS